MRPERGHEFVEHTADLGLLAWGPDVAAAFEEAARALFEYMVDLDRAAPAGSESIALRADSLERLLFSFLDELLFRHQSKLVVYAAFHARIARGADGAWALDATVGGEPLDAERHGHVHEVKAMTFHGIRVAAGPPAEAFILVDI